jgi:hypothetical protein
VTREQRINDLFQDYTAKVNAEAASRLTADTNLQNDYNQKIQAEYASHVADDQFYFNTLNASKQTNLGFVPVRTGYSGSIIEVGYQNASGLLRVAIDAQDRGTLWSDFNTVATDNRLQFANGWMLQFFKVNIGQTGSFEVAFPVAFPRGCFFCTGSFDNGAPSGATGGAGTRTNYSCSVTNNYPAVLGIYIFAIGY